MSKSLALAALVGAVYLVSGSAVPTAQTAAPGTVTFTKDVAPIFQKACQNCHRPGSIAPMSLLTYEDARPWARSIKDRVERRSMPPWHVDRTVGIRRFKDDPSLSDNEIATIVSWIDAGAPKGNAADMPAPRQFEDSDRWHIGKPDLIVEMPRSFEVKPEAADWWGNFIADSGLTEDRYIKAVEAKPSAGAVRVVHHAVETLEYEDGTPSGGTLVEYAVGKNGDIFPDGSGKLMKAGARVRFNMHYHAIGKPVLDRTSVGIVFYPKGVVPKHVMTTILSPNQDDLDIPAGADNVRSDAYYKFDKNARLVGFMPHMHNRGKRQCIEAIYPNMQIEQFNCVNYDFQWQIVYNYADDVAPLLPAGTIVHVISWHDNSVANKYNPDPRNWVGFGNRTTDDMSRHWLTYYTMSDEEFKAEQAERAALKKKTNE
ncbi:MAG TPA: cytochrome c [Vicinamibacterales bacterium]|nr:cytochrome c [Vicinamibacterales bacterium]